MSFQPRKYDLCEPLQLHVTRITPYWHGCTLTPPYGCQEYHHSVAASCLHSRWFIPILETTFARAEETWPTCAIRRNDSRHVGQMRSDFSACYQITLQAPRNPRIRGTSSHGFRHSIVIDIAARSTTIVPQSPRPMCRYGCIKRREAQRVVRGVADGNAAPGLPASVHRSQAIAVPDAPATQPFLR